MKHLHFTLVVRHNRVLPKLFSLVERLGADCLDIQGNLNPATGGRLRMTLACPPARAHRLKPQIERLVDVSELFETQEFAPVLRTQEQAA